MNEQKKRYFTYGAGRRREISFPLGGIGTGCIGLDGSGRLIDWEFQNRPDKGSVNGFSHFAVKAERDGRVLDTRLVNGPFEGRLAGDIQSPPFRSFGFGVRREYLTGLPHFTECEFEGFFPAAKLSFGHRTFPGELEMTATSPFIPNDADASSLPVAMFAFKIRNTTEAAIDYTVFGALASIENIRQTSELHRSDLTTTLRFAGSAGISGCSGGDGDSGSHSITAIDGERSHQRFWYRGNWFDSLQVYWDDINRPGPLVDRVYGDGSAGVNNTNGPAQDHGTVASSVRIEPGEEKILRFLIAWHFPNFEKYWPSSLQLVDRDEEAENSWSNFYANRWPDLAAVERECIENWDRLWTRTMGFRNALSGSTLPYAVLDAVSANLAVLRSPTVTRLSTGALYGFEGCHVDAGCCEGSCTHVWNYQQATPFLFPELARSMLELEFRESQIPETGGLAFRLPLPLSSARNIDRPCADGHFGSVMKVYREWKISGDDTWLRKNWDGVKRAIEFAWQPGNYDLWDPDRTGVLWGRQHHTLDMELFGPNSWLTGFYLGALRAGALMAEHLGDNEAMNEFQAICDRGRAWVSENLFNGSYFIQKVDLGDKSVLKPFAETDEHHPVLQGDIGDLYWSEEHGELKYQIADGCNIDQVLAQWHASLYGIGEIFEPGHTRAALNAIYENNFKEDLGDVANPCRVFGVAGEAGTLICSYPERAAAPAIPLPYAQETQHGYEYAFACALLQVGEIEKGVRAFRAIRDRYRGHNRNPWNEIECGSNYARSMASFAGLVVLSGMTFDLSRGHIGFEPKVSSGKRFECFWSVGGAWGTVEYSPASVRLLVLGGDTIELQSLSFGATVRGGTLRINGSDVAADFVAGTIRFEAGALKPGDVVDLVEARVSFENTPDTSKFDGSA